MNGLRGNLGCKLEGSVTALHNEHTGKQPLTDFRVELAQLVNIYGISFSKIVVAWPAKYFAAVQYSIYFKY